MNDRWKIITGLILFLALVTFPVWINISTGTTAQPPELKIETQGTPGRDKCIFPKDEIIAQHMDLLNTWRDEVVRYDQRVYIADDGRHINKSLTHTCLDCHTNRADFCDRCHNYMGVAPYCWDCHLEPKEYK